MPVWGYYRVLKGKISISLAIVLWVIIFAVGLSGILGSLLMTRVTKDIKREEVARLDTSLRNTERHIESQIDLRLATLHDLAAFPALSLGVLSPKEKRIEIVQFMNAIRVGARRDPLTLIDFSGDLIHSTSTSDVLKDDVWRELEPELQDPDARTIRLLGKSSNPTVLLAVPVAPDGLFEGALLNWVSLKGILDSSPRPDRLRVSFASDGSLISTSGEPLGPNADVRHSVSRLGVVLETSIDEQRLSARRSRALIEMAALLAVPVGIAATLSVLLGHWIVGRPLLELTRRVDEISTSGAETPSNTQRIGRLTEIATLADHFDRMSLAVHEREAKLQASNRDLQRFAFVAAHDLREPLRTIANYLELVDEESGDDLGEEVQGYIDLTRTRCHHLMGMLDDLLTMARLSSDYEPEVVALNDVMAHVFDHLELSIKTTDAQIEVGDLTKVLGSPSMLVLLFQNLLSNALKFVKPGEAPKVSIQATKSNSPRTIRVVVRDHGIGFDEAHADRIFEIFSRLHGRGRFSGSGIGLALCKRVTELHGGRIWAEATPDDGAAFTVELLSPDNDQLDA